MHPVLPRDLGSRKYILRIALALTRTVDLSEVGISFRARSIGLIRIRRTHPFSDDAFDWAQLNPDESSELIRVVRNTQKYGPLGLDAHSWDPRQ